MQATSGTHWRMLVQHSYHPQLVLDSIWILGQSQLESITLSRSCAFQVHRIQGVLTFASAVRFNGFGCQLNGYSDSPYGFPKAIGASARPTNPANTAKQSRCGSINHKWCGIPKPNAWNRASSANPSPKRSAAPQASPDATSQR